MAPLARQVHCMNSACGQEYGAPVFFCARCGEQLVSGIVRVEAGGMVIAVDFHDGNHLFLAPVLQAGPIPVLEVQFRPLQNQVTVRTADAEYEKTAREMFDALVQGEVWKLD